jgi:single-strand DNA-binding protein
MNHFVGIGRLTGAAELKYTANGTAVTKFSICINKVWKNANGERQEKPHFFNCVLWGKYGEAMQRLLTKGKQIGIQGELEQSTWVGNDGTNHSTVQINVSDIDLLASPRGEAGASNHNEAPPQGSKAAGNEKPNAAPGADDVPF